MRFNPSIPNERNAWPVFFWVTPLRTYSTVHIKPNVILLLIKAVVCGFKHSKGPALFFNMEECFWKINQTSWQLCDLTWVLKKRFGVTHLTL